MKKTFYTFFCLSLFMLQSCSEGFVMIEKSESFNKNKNEIRSAKIVYLEPSVNAYRIREEAHLDNALSQKKETELYSTLESASKYSGFKAEFIDKKEHVATYMNVLQRLEKDIYTSILVQDHPLNKGRATGSSGVRQKVFVYTPTISPEYSSLVNEFNTPFYGVIGIFSVDAKPSGKQAYAFLRSHDNITSGRYYYYYNIIVDVNRAEVIYREIKKIDEPLKNASLRVALYDSFSMLKSNTKK